MSSHLQYGLLNTDIPMIFLYQVGSIARVSGILYPTSNTSQEFILNKPELNLGVSPNYFILSLQQPSQMAYVYPENIVHGPLWYQKFIYENQKLRTLGERKRAIADHAFSTNNKSFFPRRLIYGDLLR